MEAIAWDAMKKYGFRPSFGNAVMQEADAIDPDVRNPSWHDAQDLRELLWSSIDNIDSRDLDQMEYCEREKNGEIHVQVAIADVDSRVPKNSRIDQYAAYNGASIYLDVHTFPMLPDQLSAGITSLLPGKDCPAMIVDYWVLMDGTIRYGTVYRAHRGQQGETRVRAGGRLARRDRARCRRPWRRSRALRPSSGSRTRRQSGSGSGGPARGLSPSRRSRRRRSTRQGAVKDLVVLELNAARSLIEEFMVAANRTMMAFLSAAGIPRIERIVRTPQDWEGIVLTAAALGETLPAQPDVQALSQFLVKRRAADPERFPDLSLTIVKLMGPGEYALLEPGSRADRALRPRGDRLHPRHRPEPALRRPGDPAALKVRDR